MRLLASILITTISSDNTTIYLRGIAYHAGTVNAVAGAQFIFTADTEL